MATINGSTSYSPWTFKLETTEGTADITNNTSPLTVDIYLGRYSSSGSYAEGGIYNISVSVTGCATKTTTYSNEGKRIDIVAGGWLKLGSVTFPSVPHDADGKKTVTVSASFTFTNSPKSGSASGSVTLTKIPRNATITSAPDFNDEENPTIQYSNPLGSSAEEIEAGIYWSDAGGSAIAGYREIDKDKNSYTFELTEAERETLLSVTSGPSRKVFFYIRTLIGGSYYYDKVEKTVTIVNANPIFSEEQVSFRDTNAAVVAVTENNQIIVKGKSYITIDYTAATALKGASIKKFNFSVVGGTVNKDVDGNGGIFEYGITNATSDLELVVSAIDSRGYSTKVNMVIPVIQYITPVVLPHSQRSDIVCQRCDTEGNLDNSGTKLKLIVKGKWSSLPEESNIATVDVKYSTTGYESDWIPVSAERQGGGAENSYISWYDIDSVVDGVTLDADKAYTVTVRCIDELSDYDDIDFKIPTEDVCFHLKKGGRGAAFGEYAEEDDVFKISKKWDFKLKGKILRDFIIEQGTSDDGCTTYRLWNSGVMEMWFRIEIDTVALNKTYGEEDKTAILYFGNYDWNFPMQFADHPVVTCSHFQWLTGASWGTVASVSSTTAVLRGLDVYIREAGERVTISAYAKGRWKEEELNTTT